MTTRATHLLLCSVALLAILIFGGCQSRRETTPATPAATYTPVHATPLSPQVATVKPTAQPIPSPVLLLGAGSRGTIIAAWPAGQIKQFVAPGSPLYGQPLSPDGRQMVIETQRANREPREFAILNLVDGRIQPLHLLSEPYTVHWSPVARWLAFRAAGYRDGTNCHGGYALELATAEVSIVEEGSCQRGPLFWVVDLAGATH